MSAPPKRECRAGTRQVANLKSDATNYIAQPAKFKGTANPRHLRALEVLLRRPLPRESLDSVAGASNSPELVAELRRRGLDVPCERIHFIDRDGRDCRPGVYRLSEADRRKVHQWQARRGGAT